MPNPASRPERDFCSNCGFPVRSSRCDACGVTQAARPAHDTSSDVPTRENKLRAYVSPVDGDLAGLERAFDAFRAKDLPHFVELLLASEAGTAPRSAPTADGPGWIATVRGALVFVTLRIAADEIVMEAPVACLPERQRLPALRIALELCARDAAASRVCLRGELLLLRFNARLSLLTPPVLRHYLREIGHLSARYAGLLTVSLDAPPAILDGQRAAIGFDAIGHAKKIHLGAGKGVRGSTQPSYPAEPVQGAPILLERRAKTQRIMARPLPREAGVGVPDGTPEAIDPPAPTVRPLERGSSKAPRAGALSAAEGALPAADRLCVLLRLAQSLASLALEERPATMTWLVRSAVFRAIYDFKDALPDAIAHLYRCTGISRDVHRSSSGQHHATEPALLVMERLIVSRGQVQREKPLSIEPMTSAAQAKEHVARYLLEIDRSPADPALRHFLAVGALTELLVRTKLPPQTDQRLRDIVAHAQREGAKNPAIDLMMTALQRINS